MSINQSLIIIFCLIKITLQKNTEVSEIDLNKAISCLHITSNKFDNENKNIDQKIFSSSILSCFTLISEDESKNTLLSVQQDMCLLSPEDIERLTDIKNLNNYNKTILVQQSKKLENALKTFNDIGNNKNNNIIREYKINKDKKNKNSIWKIIKSKKVVTIVVKLLRYLNKLGYIIVVIVWFYFLYFIYKRIKTKKQKIKIRFKKKHL